MLLNRADARGNGVLGRRKEHRQETARDQVIDFLLGFAQAHRLLIRRHDGKVIADFGVVKNALVRFDIGFLQRGFGVRCQVFEVACGQHFHRRFDGVDIVLGQRARIGTRVSQGFVALVQRLCNLQSGFGAVAKFAIGLALQAGQVKQHGRGLRGRLGFFLHHGGLALAGRGYRQRLFFIPQAVGFGIAVGQVTHRFFPGEV